MDHSLRPAIFLSFVAVAFILAACASDIGPRDATWIETDQNTGSIRFIVNGQEQARIDASGMHVRKGVETANGVTLGQPYGAATEAEKQ